MTKSEMMKMIKQLQAQASDKKAMEVAKRNNERVFSLVVKNAKGEKIRRLRQLTYNEAFKQQRDWYRVLVLSMKQKIGLHIEFDKVG